ncbi:hypothetical protein CR513_48896, partial [Mucuna pruriens]
MNARREMRKRKRQWKRKKKRIEEEKLQSHPHRASDPISTLKASPNTSFQNFVWELHKRRLQLKSKSKFKTKSKDGANKKSHGGDLSSQHSGTQGLKIDHKEPSFWNDCEGFEGTNEDSTDDVAGSKKQRLYWGLDTKERWERKSN